MPQRSALPTPAPGACHASPPPRQARRRTGAPLHASATWAGSRRSPTMYLARASPSTARMSNTVTSHRPLSRSCTEGAGGGEGWDRVGRSSRDKSSGGCAWQRPASCQRQQAAVEKAGSRAATCSRAATRSLFQNLQPAHLLHQVPPHKAATAGDQASALLARGRCPRARRHGCRPTAARLTSYWVSLGASCCYCCRYCLLLLPGGAVALPNRAN